MDNRAIILAAGRGSRMGEETDSKPKCLTKLAGKYLLDWQLEALRSAGIKNITVIRGYRSEMLSGNFDIVDNVRWMNTNMVASLFCAPPFKGDTIISYSDIVYNSEHIEKLNASHGEITITADSSWEELWSKRFENLLNDAETFKSINYILQEIGKKTDDITDIEAQYMGLLKLTEKGWQTMFDLFQTFSDAKRDEMDMTGMLNDLVMREVEINVVFVDGGWCEVDNYSDVVIYEKELKEKDYWKHDWR